MCYVQSVQTPNVEFEFFVDDCACLAAPRDMVEYWQPGNRHKMTTVRPVAEIERMSPGLWAAISTAYSAWRDGPILMIEHEPAWQVSSISSKQLQTA